MVNTMQDHTNKKSKQWYLVACGNLYPDAPIFTHVARGWKRIPPDDVLDMRGLGDVVLMQINNKHLCNRVTTYSDWVKEIVPLEKVLPKCLPLEIVFSIGEYL